MSVSRIPKRRSEKPNLARIAGEIGVAMVALIVVGAAVLLPVALSRSQSIVVTAVIAIAVIVVLAVAGSRPPRSNGGNRRKGPQNHVHTPLTAR